MDIETPTKPKQISAELTRREKLIRRGLPAIVALGGVAAALVFGGVKLHDALEQDEQVGTETVQIGQGNTAVDAVEQAVRDIAESENIPFEEFNDMVAEGQEVSREITDTTGNSLVQPEDEIEVTVTKNDFGQYDVEADPAKSVEK